MRTFHRWAAALAGLLLLTAIGCGGSPGVSSADTSDEQASVHGKVTVNGKPPTQATIEFNGSNLVRKNAGSSAPVDKDGTYSLKAHIGENQVAIIATGVEYNQTSFVVKSGENTLNIDIP